MCGPCRWGGDTLRLVSPQHIVHSRSALSPSPFRCHSRSQPVLAFRPGMPSRSLSVLLALGRSLYQRVASRRHLLPKIGRATFAGSFIAVSRSCACTRWNRNRRRRHEEQDVKCIAVPEVGAVFDKGASPLESLPRRLGFHIQDALASASDTPPNFLAVFVAAAPAAAAPPSVW